MKCHLEPVSLRLQWLPGNSPGREKCSRPDEFRRSIWRKITAPAVKVKLCPIGGRQGALGFHEVSGKGWLILAPGKELKLLEAFQTSQGYMGDSGRDRMIFCLEQPTVNSERTILSEESIIMGSCIFMEFSPDSCMKSLHFTGGKMQLKIVQVPILHVVFSFFVPKKPSSNHPG
jgi:hypothetical protein